MKVPVEEYLAYSLELSDAELELTKEFEEWLPVHIIDCHVHCNEERQAQTINPEKFRNMFSTFPWFSLDQSKRVQEMLFPRKHIRKLRFAMPFAGIDFKGANAYLTACSPPEDRVALYGIPNDIRYTTEELASGKYNALKMYPHFFEPPAQTIYDYFPTEILETAQELDVPIILHLPRMITRCMDEIMTLVGDFPRLRITLAHLGLPNRPVPGLAEAYSQVARHENIAMDTSMIPSAEVVRLALGAFGVDRIMYGSDEPLNLVRSTVYDHPQLGQRLATEFPYHWVVPDEHASFGYLAKGAIHTEWQALQAIRDALRQISSDRWNIREKLFHDNAHGYYAF